MNIPDWKRKAVQEQRQWIEDHGGGLAGYTERYGSASDPGHYGDGGEAIYKADCEALANLGRRAR